MPCESRQKGAGGGERDRDAHRDRERCTRGGVRVTKKVFSWTFREQISDSCVYIPEEGQGLLAQGSRDHVGGGGSYRSHGRLPAASPPLPMCFLWGFSPPHTPAQRFSPSLPVLPSGPLALVPTSAPRTRAWFPLFSLPEKWPRAKTWSGIEMRAGLSPTPLALCCPLLEY